MSDADTLTSSMRQVVVGIGSNTQRERHIRTCLDALNTRFADLRISRVFESEPVGFQAGGNFYNLVATFSSSATVEALRNWSKQLEQRHGRDPASPRFSPQPLDIDLLTVGQLTGTVEGVTLPRGDILDSAYVLWPLAELLPGTRHPVLGKRYDELWEHFDIGTQRLWPVDFTWQERLISSAR
ncbi:2-amino-4-hydroxy-6-hydroxymethyldihydropteridine diphosphokinase [Halomonas sp. WWR20]